MPGSSPVVTFGRFREAEIATIGLNPSLREFVDNEGHELTGSARRFHTLSSLGISSFSEAADYDVLRMINLCQRYFDAKSADIQFRALDDLLAPMGASYTFANRPKHLACHLNLVQSATRTRWRDLSPWQRNKLLTVEVPFLLQLIRLIPARLLILNGALVVSHFAHHTGVSLTSVGKPNWTMTDTRGKAVKGIAYKCTTTHLGGIDLGREILVLGYSPTLQGQWGLASPISESIARWLAHESQGWI